MRKSTRGSARGSGRGISAGDRILTRSTMTARSVGGFCASIAMGSAGAATMQLAAPQARKLALSPGGERPPKSLIALASATSSPLRFKPARTDLALSSAVDNVRRMPSAGPSVATPISAGTSIPNVSNTASSQACPPAVSTTVSLSPGSRSMTTDPAPGTR